MKSLHQKITTTHCVLLLLLVSPLSFANTDNNQSIYNQSGSTAIVGPASDNACQFNTIQAAINSGSNYQNILVVAGPANNRHVYNENIVINRGVNIVGGWENCSTAILNNYNENLPKTFINGFSNGTGIRTTSNSFAINVNLTGLEITGGNDVSGGGLVLFDSNTIITNSLIVNNYGGLGGGIHLQKVLSAESSLVLLNSQVLANTADTHGGGLYCDDSSIFMNETSAISLNQTIGTDAKGGGLYLFKCTLESFAGTTLAEFDFNPDRFIGINYNRATGSGGGIYAVSSHIKLYGGRNVSDQYPSITNGYATQPVSFNGNHADSDDNGVGDGGAVYILGQSVPLDSSIDIHKGRVFGNRAVNGGAFYIDENTFFNMHANTQEINGNRVDCWNEKCSLLSSNLSTNRGGAIYIKGHVIADVIQTHVENNRADEGTFLSSDSTDGYQNIFIHQNLIVHNGRNGSGEYADNNVIDLYNNSEIISGNNLNLSFIFNTMTDNYATNSVIGVSGVLVYVDLLSSILYDQTTPNVANLSGAFHSVNADCVVLSDTNSLQQPYVTRTRDFSIDPGFVYRHYDYHLKSSSLLIDFCDDSQSSVVFTDKDIDDELRTYDLVSLPDAYGPWDIGADEFTGTSDEFDVIFIDGVDWH